MGLDKLIQTAALVACVVIFTGQLPRFIRTIQRAQIQLIQDSKASKWPKAVPLPYSKTK